MHEAEFQRLVEFTRQAFFSEHQPEFHETPVETRARVYLKVLPERGREDFLRDLIAQSAESANAWDSVKMIGEILLRDGEQPPPGLAEWLADVLADHGKPRKDKRRPRPAKDDSPDANRDWVICGAINHVGQRFNLSPTRNGAKADICCAEGGSACDVVGRVVFGKTLKSYKNTERIWGRRDPLLTYSTRSQS